MSEKLVALLTSGRTGGLGSGGGAGVGLRFDDQKRNSSDSKLKAAKSKNCSYRFTCNFQIDEDGDDGFGDNDFLIVSSFCCFYVLSLIHI